MLGGNPYPRKICVLILAQIFLSPFHSLKENSSLETAGCGSQLGPSSDTDGCPIGMTIPLLWVGYK